MFYIKNNFTVNRGEKWESGVERKRKERSERKRQRLQRGGEDKC